MKKIINQTEDVIEEMLRGLSASYPGTLFIASKILVLL